MKDSQKVSELKRPQGLVSLLAIGDIKCDRCHKMISHLARYCCSTHECPICGVLVESALELDSHLSQEHPEEPSRGARYCIDCSQKAGYLEMVMSKKTGDMALTLFRQHGGDAHDVDAEVATEPSGTTG